VTEKCKLPEIQKQKYNEVLQSSKKIWTQRNVDSENDKKKTAKKKGRKKVSDELDDLVLDEEPKSGGSGASFGILNNILMQMRKMANHPLLCRSFYTQDQVVTIRDILKQSDPDHIDDDPEYLLEDLEMCSDYDLHMTCKDNSLLSGLKLSDEQLFESAAKMIKLRKLLKELKANGNRVLLFSQMTKVLDILELFLEHEGYSFVRLDGQTPVNSRQEIIDDYNKDRSIFIFLLSTKAGGMGINLTSAETVIFYDISFNPQVDKQAEDRCHRLGQDKQVKVIKLIAEDTVDQYMLQLSEQKKELHDSMLEEGAFEKEKGSKMEAKKLLKMFDTLFNNLPQE
jgi:SWI/SNF-related matrix-associated actin-dependent regulator 1 of chromatin subfamily A